MTITFKAPGAPIKLVSHGKGTVTPPKPEAETVPTQSDNESDALTRKEG
jgi:hypothetical protein